MKKNMNINNTNNTNANNTNKEEQNMKQTTKKSLFGALQNKMQDKAEKANIKISVGAEKPKAFASKEHLGLWDAKINSIQEITLKNEGNPDKGEDPKFVTALKLDFSVDGVSYPPAYITNRVYLFEGDKKVNVDIYKKFSADGRNGWFCQVKTDSLDKKPEELDVDDLNIYEIAEGQHVWSTAEADLEVLTKTLQLDELEFNDDGYVIMPKGITLPIFIYEDIVTKTEETKKMDLKAGKLKITKKDIKKSYFNISFVSPADDYKQSKYGNYFTNSESITHKKECLELPGVKAYEESLKK